MRGFVTTILAASVVVASLLFGECEAVGHEPSRLPPVDDSSDIGTTTLGLNRRIRELEEIVAGLQSNVTPAPNQPTKFWQPESAGAPQVQNVSFFDECCPDDYTIDIGGYVKADFIHDFDAILSEDAFDSLTIPTDGRAGENTRFHAKQTRLNLDFREVDGDLQLFVEGDFFGAGNGFRLRHAYIRVGRLLAGQTWSTFMDESILPRTLDFESPRSVILDRRGIARWTQPLTDNLSASIAVEDPRLFLDRDSAPAGSGEKPIPDLIGRLRYEDGWGHLQAAGLVRQLRYRQDTGTKDDVAGWGMNFTGRVRRSERDSVLFQMAFGEGFESYRNAPEAAVNAVGEIELIPAIAWVIGYEIDWTECVSSTLVYSEGRGTNTAFQLDDAPRATEYVAANIIFRPRPRLSWGIEYLYGTRTDKDGSRGEANRIQCSVRYDLP